MVILARWSTLSPRVRLTATPICDMEDAGLTTACGVYSTGLAKLSLWHPPNFVSGGQVLSTGEATTL